MIGFNADNMINRIFSWFLILTLIACTNSEEVVKKITQNEATSKPLSITKDLGLIYSDSGLIRAKLKAPLRETYIANADHRVIFPKGVDILFYESDDKTKTSHLTANYAISYELEERMEVKNKVRITNSKGEKLLTEHLIWDRRKQRIYSNEYTQIIKPDKVLEGNSFESNETFTQYKITKLKGDIQLKDE